MSSKFLVAIGEDALEAPEEITTLDGVVASVTTQGVTEFKVYKLVGDFKPENKVVNVLDKENV